MSLCMNPSTFISVNGFPKVKVYYLLSRNFQLTFQNFCSTSFPHQQCIRVPISLYHCQHWMLSIFIFCKAKGENGLHSFFQDYFKFPHKNDLHSKSSFCSQGRKKQKTKNKAYLSGWVHLCVWARTLSKRQNKLHCWKVEKTNGYLNPRKATYVMVEQLEADTGSLSLKSRK